MSAPAIAIRGLRVVRGRREVIPPLDLDVGSGRITGLVGPSGSGKSTLMRSIVGVQIVAGGEVTVLGEPAGTASLRRDVAYVTQSGSVYDDLTVRENIAYLARILGLGPAAVADTIGTVGLEGFEDRPVARLSGGQRHRVSLAGALLGSPRLLVLDEPTVGAVQAIVATAWTVGVLGLDVTGSVAALVVIAILNAELGMAFGLGLSTFATTEFQAVQFMPAFILPQLLLCGLLVPRSTMSGGLQAVADVLPMTYAYDALAAVTRGDGSAAATDAAVTVGFCLLGLALGALTLRRRTA